MTTRNRFSARSAAAPMFDAPSDTPELHERTLEVRAIRKEAREVDFVCSTETKDTYGTVLRQNWDLKRYKRNPVVLYAHNSRELPIGKAIKIAVKDGELQATVRIAPAEVNPFAENVWLALNSDFLRGISVGFYPREIREEKIDDKWVLILDDLELLELSITPLPSNPDALIQKARSRAVRTTPETSAPSAPKTPTEERGAKETSMDPKDKEIAELKTRNAELTGQVQTLEKQNAEARSTLAKVEKEHERAVQERDAAAKELDTFRTKDVERDVDAIIAEGKADKDERDELIDFARTDRARFDRLMAKRKPKTPAGTEGLREGVGTGKSVLGDSKVEARSLVADDSVADEFERDFAKSNGFAARG